MRFAMGDKADAGLLGAASVEPGGAGDETGIVEVLFVEGTWVWWLGSCWLWKCDADLVEGCDGDEEGEKDE
jgi:hypothetical protein